MRRRGRTTACRQTSSVSARTPEPQQVWAGGHGRVHTGGGHEGPARQVGPNVTRAAAEIIPKLVPRPHAAVTVAPEDVETKPAASFRVYQDNAAKFKQADEEPSAAIGGGGGVPGPANAARSFQPQYGAVREVSSYDSMAVRTTDGSETLLKHALPVPRGSAEPKARLTRRPVPLAVRQLRPFNSGPTAPP